MLDDPGSPINIDTESQITQPMFKHVCNLCSTMFNTKNQCEIHMKTCEMKSNKCGQLLYQCEICDQTCDFIDEFFSHWKKIHESREKCYLCSTICDNLSHLKNHLSENHNRKIAYLCEICEITTFQTPHERNLHKRENHKCDHNDHIKYLRCSECGRKLFNYEMFEKHCIDKHGKIDLCEIEYQSNITKQPMKCRACEKTFHVKNDLFEHYINDHQRWLQCDICENNAVFRTKICLENHCIGQVWH